MQRLTKLQLVSPLALFATVLAAESAAFALAYAPSSAWLWYLNLEFFSIFRKSRTILSEACNLPFAQLFLIAGPLAIVACIGLALKNNLITAISSNLSFVYAGFLVFSWQHWHSFGHVKAASATWIHVPSGGAIFIVTVLLPICFISFAASHYWYFRATRNEI